MQNISAEKQHSRHPGLLLKNKKLCIVIVAITLLFSLFAIPASSTAENRRFVLEYGDGHFRSHKGRETTLYLKKALHQQYPWINISNLELTKVVLVAKTKKGFGDVQLRVGKQVSGPYRVHGSPRGFGSSRPDTFDRIRIRTPRQQGQGPWQLYLRGNFKVRKVVLVVEQRYPEQYYGWWRHKW